MKGYLRNAFLVATAAMTLAGCEKAPTPTEKKAEAMAQIILNSETICERGPVNPTKDQYDARLMKVLLDMPTASLQALVDKDVTVCMDQRLGAQVTDPAHTRIDAIYYSNAGGKGGTIALWDNGKQPVQVQPGEHSAYGRGDDKLETIAQRVLEGNVPTDGSKLYAGEYGDYHLVYWKTPDKFDQTSIASNPQLQNPPPKPADFKAPAQKDAVKKMATVKPPK